MAMQEQIRHLRDQLTIRIYGDPCLRIPGEEVKVFDKNLESLCWAMLGIMDRAGGVGLAAQQVGLKSRICIIDTSCQWDQQTLAELDSKNLLCVNKGDLPFPLFLINAKVVNQSDELQELSEGCLSGPGIYANVRRYQWVEVSYQDCQGFFHQIRADGLLGQCLQHEIDHNNGIFFTDPERLSPADREKVQPLLDELANQQPV
jgi:peptide deformylase